MASDILPPAHRMVIRALWLQASPNDVVRPIHLKAMPVVLTEPDEVELWLKAPAAEALGLQRSLPAEKLRVVASIV